MSISASIISYLEQHPEVEYVASDQYLSEVKVLPEGIEVTEPTLFDRLDCIVFPESTRVKVRKGQVLLASFETAKPQTIVVHFRGGRPRPAREERLSFFSQMNPRSEALVEELLARGRSYQRDEAINIPHCVEPPDITFEVRESWDPIILPADSVKNFRRRSKNFLRDRPDVEYNEEIMLIGQRWVTFSSECVVMTIPFAFFDEVRSITLYSVRRAEIWIPGHPAVVSPTGPPRTVTFSMTEMESDSQKVNTNDSLKICVDINRTEVMDFLYRSTICARVYRTRGRSHPAITVSE